MAGKPLVYWDSCIFISHLKNETRADPLDMQGVAELVRLIETNRLGLVTSVITLTEVLQGKLTTKTAQQFKDFLSRPEVVVIDVDRRVAQISHDIRDHYDKDGSGNKTLSTPDAIHLASAVGMKCAKFYTFDGDAGQKPARPRALLPLSSTFSKLHGVPIIKPEPTQLMFDFPTT